MALVDDFKTRFPEFDTEQVDTYLPVLDSVWPSYFNAAYNAETREAVLNLVAHLFVGETTGGATGGTGRLAGKAVGKVSVSYQADSDASEMTDYFRSTKYGQRFVRLRAAYRGGVFV